MHFKTNWYAQNWPFNVTRIRKGARLGIYLVVKLDKEGGENCMPRHILYQYADMLRW